MCAGDYNSPALQRDRCTVTRGLPPCLTEVGIAEVVFRPGTSYHDQQAAFTLLTKLTLRDSNRNESWVHGEHQLETDC